MRVKTLRLTDELSEEITRRARMKGVPDADYYRLLIERGLLLESVELAMEKPIPPAYWGLCEAVLETRNILRSLAATREHSTIPKAQVQAKDELERMKSDGAAAARDRPI
jgi:hypothetical protein